MCEVGEDDEFDCWFALNVEVVCCESVYVQCSDAGLRVCVVLWVV